MASVVQSNAPAQTASTPLPGSVTSALIQRLAARVTASPGADRLTTKAPYSGLPLADVPMSTAEDVKAAFEVARVAQRRWATVPLRERAKIMLRYHDLMLQRQDEVMDLIQAENGKARKDAFLEVGDSLITARVYARRASGYLKKRRRPGLFPVVTKTYEYRHPKGVVGIISPWNYPLALAAGDTIPALLAGNAVVHKPDRQTILTALWAMDLMYEAGLPEGLWQIVAGAGREIGQPLIDNADYLMFTGSTATGRKMATAAAERLIASSMELGGKNAMVVLDDADVEKAAHGAIRACFSSTGQLCISMERMYIPDSLWDRFVPSFVEKVKAMKLGAAYDQSIDMGSLISQEQLDTVIAHVEDARSKGATVLAGGRARPDLGPYFYEPTVLTDVSDDMVCFGEETFGPLVSLYRYSAVEDAIKKANDTRYGLNASVWTGNPSRGREVGARLHAGTININEGYGSAWGSVGAPMGGMGDSGLGRRHGAEGIQKYTEAQTIAEQRWLGVEPPIKKMSQETYNKLLSTTLKGMKRIGWR